MLRMAGKQAAVITLIGDLVKGVIPVLIAKSLGLSFNIQLLVGLAAFLGHLYPLFFGFKGGKGVATALGILLALNPWLGLATLAVWLLVFALTRLSSLSALTASALAPFLGAWLTGSRMTVLTLCLITALLVWRHRANIRRLLAGEESAFRKG